MTRRLRLLLVLTTAILVARPVLAGPPLLCFPFEIGTAKSLPIGIGGWHAIDGRYDTSRLIDDTLALLTPPTPIVTRMETLRRATLYAAKDQRLATVLLDRLQQRASVPSADAALAVFDFGYLVETYKQAASLFDAPVKAAQNVDGYNLVAKASAMRGDPAIEFALAVMTRGNSRVASEHRAHLAHATEGARTDALIQANLSKQFGESVSGGQK
jgi:hypothetical protein